MASFDYIDHERLLQMIGYRIIDPRILRLIQKWLKAGVREEGVWSETEAGSPQGAVISPLLSNIYLYYVLDQWTDQWRQAAQGDIVIVRYADDAILGFQHQKEAERYLKQLQEHLRPYGLELNEDKTRLIRFGRFAALNRAERGEGKPETFSFLGFRHICGKTRQGDFVVRRITDSKRRCKKLCDIAKELRRRMHEPVATVGEWLQSVLRGYYQYHAVPGNLHVLSRFRRRVLRLWWGVLRRRSQQRPVWVDWLLCSITGCPALLLYIHFRACASTPASKVGTLCGSPASTGLCGGWLATAIPTATFQRSPSAFLPWR